MVTGKPLLRAEQIQQGVGAEDPASEGEEGQVYPSHIGGLVDLQPDGQDGAVHGRCLLPALTRQELHVAEGNHDCDNILGKSVEREVGCCRLGDLFLLPLLVHLALLGARGLV